LRVQIRTSLLTIITRFYAAKRVRITPQQDHKFNVEYVENHLFYNYIFLFSVLCLLEALGSVGRKKRSFLDRQLEDEVPGNLHVTGNVGK